jgi:hypothetical protein
MNPPQKGAGHDWVRKRLLNASTQAGLTLRKNNLDGATKCEALHGTASPPLNMIPRERAATVPLAERVYAYTLSHHSAVGIVEHSVRRERSLFR